MALGAFERANAGRARSDRDREPCACSGGSACCRPGRVSFVISQSTLAGTRRLAFEDTLLRLPPGFSASITGNANDGKRGRRPVEGLADALPVGLPRARWARVLASSRFLSAASGW